MVDLIKRIKASFARSSSTLLQAGGSSEELIMMMASMDHTCDPLCYRIKRLMAG